MCVCVWWGMVGVMFKVGGVLVVSRIKGTLRFWEQSVCQMCAVKYVKI